MGGGASSSARCQSRATRISHVKATQRLFNITECEQALAMIMRNDGLHHALVDVLQGGEFGRGQRGVQVWCHGQNMPAPPAEAKGGSRRRNFKLTHHPGTPWLDVFCQGCGTSRAIDLRALDRHPLASVGTLLLGLRCSWCPGSAPMPKLFGLYALPPVAAAGASQGHDRG
jgi:hypothetical protein